MAKYLFQASYTPEGLRGLMKDGGTKRRQVIEKMAEGIGGKVETVYFAFGDTDVYVIVEAPDNVSAATVAMTVSATGTSSVKTVVLLTPEEIDQATKGSVVYSSPGQ